MLSACERRSAWSWSRIARQSAIASGARRGPSARRRRLPDEPVGDALLVAGHPRVADAALPGRVGLRRAAGEPVHERLRAVQPREAEVVAAGGERAAQRVEAAPRRPPGAASGSSCTSAKNCAVRAWASASASPARRRDPDRLGRAGGRPRAAGRAGRARGRAPAAAARRAGSSGGSSARARSSRLTPAGRSPRCSAAGPAAARRRRGRRRERAALARRARAQLARASGGPARGGSRRARVPRPRRASSSHGGVALVQVGARGLRQQLVDDVADEDVGEAVARLARAARLRPGG